MSPKFLFCAESFLSEKRKYQNHCTGMKQMSNTKKLPLVFIENQIEIILCTPSYTQREYCWIKAMLPLTQIWITWFTMTLVHLSVKRKHAIHLERYTTLATQNRKHDEDSNEQAEPKQQKLWDTPRVTQQQRCSAALTCKQKKKKAERTSQLHFTCRCSD